MTSTNKHYVRFQLLLNLINYYNYFRNVTNCSFILTEKAKTRIIVILYEDSIDMVAMYTCVLPSLIPVIVETKLGLYLLQKYKENQCSK